MNKDEVAKIQAKKKIKIRLKDKNIQSNWYSNIKLVLIFNWNQEEYMKADTKSNIFHLEEKILDVLEEIIEIMKKNWSCSRQGTRLY